MLTAAEKSLRVFNDSGTEDEDTWRACSEMLEKVDRALNTLPPEDGHGLGR